MVPVHGASGTQDILIWGSGIVVQIAKWIARLPGESALSSCVCGQRTSTTPAGNFPGVAIAER